MWHWWLRMPTEILTRYLKLTNVNWNDSSRVDVSTVAMLEWSWFWFWCWSGNTNNDHQTSSSSSSRTSSSWSGWRVSIEEFLRFISLSGGKFKLSPAPPAKWDPPDLLSHFHLLLIIIIMMVITYWATYVKSKGKERENCIETKKILHLCSEVSGAQKLLRNVHF